LFTAHAAAAAAAAAGFRLIKNTTSTSRPTTVSTSVDSEDARLLPVAQPAVEL